MPLFNLKLQCTLEPWSVLIHVHVLYYPGYLSRVGCVEERGGSVVECLTRDRWVAGFEPHRRHCVVSLSKTLYPLLSAGSNKILIST